jgi:antitoxin CcdA
MSRKKQLSEPAKGFRHSGRIGQPPKPGRKRAVNVTVDEHVLADAKRFGINLSQVLEDGLRTRVTEEKTRRWQEENREALESHNRFIEKHGIWSVKYRSW